METRGFGRPELPKVTWRETAIPAREMGPGQAPPFLPWADFLQAWSWRQGEHVSLLGPTGTGKTTFAKAILGKRDYVVAIATKPKDPGLDALGKSPGWKRVPEWPPPKKARKVLLWPPFKKPDYERGQARIVAEAFEEIFEDGGWAILLDEVYYITNDLKLEHWLNRFWTQGRSLGLTVIGGTQRPAFVPLNMYSAASWLVMWRTNDRRDLDRLAGLGSANSDAVRKQVQNLARHEVLVVDTREGSMLRTRVDLPRR